MKDAIEFVFSSYMRFWGTWFILITVAAVLSQVRLFSITNHSHRDQPKPEKKVDNG